MRLQAPPEMREEVAKDVARRRAIKGYPPVEEFIEAFVSERLGNPALMNAYIASCQAVIRRRSSDGNRQADIEDGGHRARTSSGSRARKPRV